MALEFCETKYEDKWRINITDINDIDNNYNTHKDLNNESNTLDDDDANLPVTLMTNHLEKHMEARTMKSMKSIIRRNK